jgi:hypothetical protein
MNPNPNDTRQPMPGVRPEACRMSLPGRGCARRWAANVGTRVKFALSLLSVVIRVGANAQSSFSPDLTQFLLSHPATSLALSNAFAEASSVRKVEIYYFYTQDESAPQTRHHYLGDSSTVGIFVRENQAACDQCIGILFELLNSKGEKRFRELWELASSGGISKASFVREILRQEFQAVTATRGLIRAFDLKPEDIAKSKSYTQFMQSPDDFDGFLAHSQKASQGADQKAYEDLYDRIRKTPKQ